MLTFPATKIYAVPDPLDITPQHPLFSIHAGADFYYAGQWQDDAPHGKGTRQLTSGLMEHGEFEAGKLAMGYRGWPNGDFEDGRFVEGILLAGRRRRNGHVVDIS
jgi:hypothetical protein